MKEMKQPWIIEYSKSQNKYHLTPLCLFTPRGGDWQAVERIIGAKSDALDERIAHGLKQ